MGYFITFINRSVILPIGNILKLMSIKPSQPIEVIKSPDKNISNKTKKKQRKQKRIFHSIFPHSTLRTIE